MDVTGTVKVIGKGEGYFSFTHTRWADEQEGPLGREGWERFNSPRWRTETMRGKT